MERNDEMIEKTIQAYDKGYENGWEKGYETAIHFLVENPETYKRLKA